MSQLFRLTYFVASFAALAGCASGPSNLPYKAPDASQPSVVLTVLPPEYGLGRHESERLARHAVDCRPDGQWTSQRMDLTRYSSSPTEPAAASVALPVGRVYFNYVRLGNQESCAINFSAKLEPGHAYAMMTRRNHKGFFKGSECTLVMVDSTTRQPVELERESANPDFGPMCRRQTAPVLAMGGGTN